MRRFAVVLLAAAAVIPVAAASGADPSSGKISAASPTVAWSGTLSHPYPYHLAFSEEPNPGAFPCNAPGCDTFTLDVADSADLTITATSEQAKDTSMRIQKPDGSWVYVNGWSDSTKPATLKIKKAPTGTYTINVTARIFGSGNPTAVDDTADYKGTATLATAPAAVTPPVVAMPTPAAPAPP